MFSSRISTDSAALNPHPQTAHPQPKFPEQSQEPTGSEAEMTPAPDFGEKSYVGHDRLKDHICVVTGGDSGIGRAVCLAFAREGANVVCGYYQHDQDAKVTERVVKESGRECLLVKADLSEDSECKRLVDAAVAKFGRIDVLVNNAAYQRQMVEDVTMLDRERVEKTFKTNILSMFSIVRYALPHMKEGSNIINTGSVQAYHPSATILDYACTKGAIVSFTKGLAQQLIDKGIRVNCVAPGPVWTPLVVSSFPKEKNAEFGSQYPYKRPAQPVEMAGAYVFLASQEARYVSGEILSATGGKPTA